MDTTTDKYNAVLETAKKWIADGCSEKELTDYLRSNFKEGDEVRVIIIKKEK